MSNTFTYIPNGTYINIRAMNLLQIKPAEYMFLMLIDGYQSKSTTGWAELGNGNAFKTISLFKKQLGNYCGLDRTTITRLSERMQKDGYLEIKSNGFRVTPKFWVLRGDGEDNKTPSDATPSVSEVVFTDDKKEFFVNTPYNDFEYFKTFVADNFPNEKDIDIKVYHDEFKTYWGGKAYKHYDLKIKDWIGKHIKAGDVKRITNQSETKDTPSVNRTNDELTADIKADFKEVGEVENVDFQEFKKRVVKYIEDGAEAERRGILPKKYKDDIDGFKALLNEAGGLRKQFEAFKAEFQSLKPAANDS